MAASTAVLIGGDTGAPLTSMRCSLCFLMVTPERISWKGVTKSPLEPAYSIDAERGNDLQDFRVGDDTGQNFKLGLGSLARRRIKKFEKNIYSSLHFSPLCVYGRLRCDMSAIDEVP